MRRLALPLLLALSLFCEARAHSELRASTPRAGERLAAPPEAFELRFNEGVQLTALRLFDGAGKPLPFTPARDLTARDVFRAPAPALPPGAYRLEWRAISADGHPVGGSIRFSVGTAP